MNDSITIERVVRNWALWRDTRQWERLRSCYAPGATLRTTWMEGTAEAFVEASIRAAANPASAFSQHMLGGTSVTVVGNRAIAETRMTLLLRAMLEGIEVDITAWGRFVDRFVHIDNDWRIARRDPIHEKDRLDPVDPLARLALDPARLVALPRAYRHIAYVQSAGGARITPDLIEHNSPEQLALYDANDRWLNGS